MCGVGESVRQWVSSAGSCGELCASEIEDSAELDRERTAEPGDCSHCPADCPELPHTHMEWATPDEREREILQKPWVC